MGIFIETLFSDPSQYFAVLILIIFSVCCHEYAHAQTALFFGDDTAALNGNLTLNPMIQMGPFSLIFCAILGIAFGSVPVTPSRMRKRYGHAVVAFAGPCMNLLLFAVFTFISVLMVSRGNKTVAVGYFQYAAVLNIVLFILNMLPVPPLDGATILTYFVPAVDRISDQVRNMMFFIVFFLVISCSDIFFRIGQTLYIVFATLFLRMLGVTSS